MLSASAFWVFLFALGCADVASRSRAISQGAPDWVNRGSLASDDGFFGVGIAQGFRSNVLAVVAADDRARGEVAKLMAERIRPAARYGTQAALALNSARAATARVAIIADHWKDPQDGTMFSLCKLDSSAFVKILRDFGGGELVSAVAETPRPPQAPKPTVPPRLSAQVSFREPSGNDRLDAGESGTVAVSLSNSGKGPAYGVRLSLSHDAGRGLSVPASVSIGAIEPGQSVKKEVTLAASEEIRGGQAQLKIDVKEANGFDAPPRLCASNWPRTRRRGSSWRRSRSRPAGSSSRER